MTREEKEQFVQMMNDEERKQATKKYIEFAERGGKLPPSGNSPEAQQRREEWLRANCHSGVWSSWN